MTSPPSQAEKKKEKVEGKYYCGRHSLWHGKKYANCRPTKNNLFLFVFEDDNHFLKVKAHISFYQAGKIIEFLAQ